MSDGVVDLAEARRKQLRHEALFLIDRALTRAELFEEAGREEEAERIREAIAKGLDEIRLATPPPWAGREAAT